ncbi:MAG: hypothetical protein OSB65_15920 [Roseibacillus sp.]|nr:hypothetical protein [Roseibacillus sp.]
MAYNTAVATVRTEGQGVFTSDPASYSLVTQAGYDAVVAERDARFTEDQIRAMSADYTMELNDAGNVQIKIFFIESADLETFTPLTVDPDSVPVVDGKICVKFPSEDRAFFKARSFFRSSDLAALNSSSENSPSGASPEARARRLITITAICVRPFIR